MKEHAFTLTIRQILQSHFPDGSALLKQSELLQYLNEKTVSAERGSKARGSFGNLYAIYVLVEDYVQRGFHLSDGYREAEGARFGSLFKRQRELPFGSKLQNHALNHRLNKEFERLFPTSQAVPILRDTTTSEYWFNENLLEVGSHNIAQAVLDVIDAYVAVKQGAFQAFVADCERMQEASEGDPDSAETFLLSLLRPNVDARIFEIVSYAILRSHYGDMLIYWGWTPETLHEETLTLYKTGRTNANDGGIDFVMQPLGRFFQVTETVDVGKYFLDIDKIQHYPITFVIKSALPIDAIRQQLRDQAAERYPVQRIIDRYMDSIEEIINLPTLAERLGSVIDAGEVTTVLSQVILHSKVEFNM